MREGDAVLASVLGVPVVHGWEGLPDHRDAIANSDSYLRDHPDAADWWTHLFLHEDGLIGVGGYKGRPYEGVVEIGYALAPTHRGRGLAVEAANGMVARAFAVADVQEVRAHTLPEENESTRLLLRLGMRRVGTVDDPEDGKIWRWCLPRPN